MASFAGQGLLSSLRWQPSVPLSVREGLAPLYLRATAAVAAGYARGKGERPSRRRRDGVIGVVAPPHCRRRCFSTGGARRLHLRRLRREPGQREPIAYWKEQMSSWGLQDQPRFIRVITGNLPFTLLPNLFRTHRKASPR